MGGILGWALPLACTVLSYGLAGGFWKLADLSTGQFCLLFVLAKVVLNTGYWIGLGCPRVEWNAFLRYTLLGQVINGFAWAGYFSALATGPAAIVQTVTAAYTALAAVLAVIFLKERLVAIQVVGVAMVVGAGMLLGYGGGSDGSAGQAGWFAYSLVTLLCWGMAVVVFKHAYNQEGANDAVFSLGNLLGMAVTLLPFGFMTTSGGERWAAGLVPLAWLVVILYAVGDLTLFAAINRGPATIVSPLSGLYPIPTIAYSALVLHEAVLGSQWVAIAMVLVAIVLVVPADDNPVMKLLRPASSKE